MRIEWITGNLPIVNGDEIEILRGIRRGESGPIKATKIFNKTRGVNYESSIDDSVMMKKPQAFDPPIHGYAKNIKISRNTIFDLEEKLPSKVSGILRECSRFLDSKLYKRCNDKDYHDVITNAFPILEDKIRDKIGVDRNYSAKTLIDYALNPKTGKLILGETESERESLYLLFRGAMGFLRNPPSHSLSEDESDIEALEIIFMIDLFLGIVDKAKLRSPAIKAPIHKNRKKGTPKLTQKSQATGSELVKIRREHSIKIMDEAFKPWLNKVSEYCKIGVSYSYSVHKIVGLEPQDPTELEYFDVAKSHLESKYPVVIKAWEQLKQVTFEHNKDFATVLEEIRKLTIKELKIPPYYSTMRGRSPEEYITVDRYVDTIYQEMTSRIIMFNQTHAEHKVHPERKWMIGEPTIEPVMHGEAKFYTLSWGSYRLAISRDEEKIKKSKALIMKTLDTLKFKDEVKTLIERENKFYKTKRENFEKGMRNIIKSLELGNVLKGKCQFCP